MPDLKSCINIGLNGTVLKASCKASDGTWKPSSIDLNSYIAVRKEWVSWSPSYVHPVWCPHGNFGAVTKGLRVDKAGILYGSFKDSIDTDRPKSVGGGAATYLQFMNESTTDVNVFWLNYQGNPVKYATVSSGQTLDQQTYIGHPWVFRDAATDEVRLGNGKEAFSPPAATEANRAVVHITDPAPGGPKSVNGGAATYLRFVNESTATVNVYWLNYEGNRVKYHTLSPKQSFDQDTYVGHPWGIRDASTDELLLANGLEVFYPPAVDPANRAVVHIKVRPPGAVTNWVEFQFNLNAKIRNFNGKLIYTFDKAVIHVDAQNVDTASQYLREIYAAHKDEASTQMSTGPDGTYKVLYVKASKGKDNGVIFQVSAEAEASIFHVAGEAKQSIETVGFDVLQAKAKAWGGLGGVGIALSANLIDAKASVFDLTLGVSATTEIGVKDDSFTAKVLGTGITLGRKVAISVGGTSFGVDFGRCSIM